ncbi:4Fe-4S dicluster domain-containing protein [Stenotrophomonas sp.]|uniref:4Fe-4S dicluster domain-containing protein n=1 Tax=Stenotrophomonas sp. TaxID=69392 RepID=UPI0029BB5FBD|nr:4Fe-4S dicluster domain-containing protein [Stenotrophomonas sp.]MDX3934887.1 4Fe-4S binding protein [Stenotrophomonas sp.]
MSNRLTLHLVDPPPPSPPPSPPPPPRAPLRWRPLLSALLLAGFYAMPWLRWDGRQALLFDLAARRFDLFGWTLWPQDVGLLLGLAAVLATALVLLTNLAGRVWCGYGCPQTLWSRLFRWIEQGIARRVPAAGAARAITHLAWMLVAAWTGITFVGFFSPIHGLVGTSWPPLWRGWETFWIVFYAAATWGNAGFLREHVCRELCPYARVHGVFCDSDTPRMHYRARRGEPRGPRMPGLGGVEARGRGLLDPTSARDYAFRAAHEDIAGPMPRFSADRLGDCLDCGACASVCPMALDVRAGPHADCIGCGDCLDACDARMRAAQFPIGLLQYTSTAAMQQRPARWLRPRTLAAAGALLALLGIGLHHVT